MSIEYCQLVMLPPEIGNRLMKVHEKTLIPTKLLLIRALEACLPTMEKMPPAFPDDSLARACVENWNKVGDLPSDKLKGGTL
jgi:hypothetical protein